MNVNEHVLKPLKRLIREPAFVVCCVVLALSGVVLQVAAQRIGMVFIKQPLELRKPLDELNESRLRPYRLVKNILIENMDVVEALGTKEYVQWVLEDEDAANDDPTKYVNLFITYYTGDPDQVPHVPEVCYQGGGANTEILADMEMQLPREGGGETIIPVRIMGVSLSSKGLMGRQETKVLYFFSANGDYKCKRNAVRFRLYKLTDKYAYFSKVELSFPKGGGMSLAEVLSAGTKLCRRLVPLLVEEHWPEWPPAETEDEIKN